MALVQVTCPPANHNLFGPGGIESITPGVSKNINTATVIGEAIYKSCTKRSNEEEI